MRDARAAAMSSPPAPSGARRSLAPGRRRIDAALPALAATITPDPNNVMALASGANFGLAMAAGSRRGAGSAARG